MHRSTVAFQQLQQSVEKGGLMLQQQRAHRPFISVNKTCGQWLRESLVADRLRLIRRSEERCPKQRAYGSLIVRVANVRESSSDRAACSMGRHR